MVQHARSAPCIGRIAVHRRGARRASVEIVGRQGRPIGRRVRGDDTSEMSARSTPIEAGAAWAEEKQFEQGTTAAGLRV